MDSRTCKYVVCNEISTPKVGPSTGTYLVVLHQSPCCRWTGLKWPNLKSRWMLGIVRRDERSIHVFCDRTYFFVWLLSSDRILLIQQPRNKLCENPLRSRIGVNQWHSGSSNVRATCTCTYPHLPLSWWCCSGKGKQAYTKSNRPHFSVSSPIQSHIMNIIILSTCT